MINSVRVLYVVVYRGCERVREGFVWLAHFPLSLLDWVLRFHFAECERIRFSANSLDARNRREEGTMEKEQKHSGEGEVEGFKLIENFDL